MGGKTSEKAMAITWTDGGFAVTDLLDTTGDGVEHEKRINDI